MDLRLKNDAIMQVVGPSGAGKTLFICSLLSNKNIFVSMPKTIYWLVGTKDGEHGLTKHYQDKLKNIKFVNGFKPNWIDLPQKHDIIIIDDLFQESNKEKELNNLFTKIARHRQVFVIYVTQNLFHQGGHHRTRNLNVHYLVLFKNPRDQTVIDFVSRQAFPNNKKFLIESFDDATKNVPHGYLFIDFTQECLDDIRVRTDIFNPNGITVYKQSTIKKHITSL